jgi:hypothetical protein
LQLLEASLRADTGNKAERHLLGDRAPQRPDRCRQHQAKRLTALTAGENGRDDDLETSLVLVLTRLEPRSTRFSFSNHELRSTRSQAVDIAENAQLDPQWLTVSISTDRCAYQDSTDRCAQESSTIEWGYQPFKSQPGWAHEHATRTWLGWLHRGGA